VTPTAQRSAHSEASRAANPRKPRRGSETPRIWTPPLRDLTPETSLGFACIEFAEQICEIELFPWQKWLLIHALELAPELTVSTLDDRGRLDPIFRFRKIVVLVARQNGKSTLSQVLSLFFLYELGTDLILGTAQDLDTAEEVWEGALDIIEETPELAERAAKPIMVNGKKTIRLVTGERYKVKAANRKAGRGLSGDLILLDELREHQTWDAWGAITKTTMARPAAMIWALSNAGDATSVVLRYLRKQAHAALGDPDGINAQDDPEALLPAGDELAEMIDLGEDGRPDLQFEDLEDDGSALGLFEWSAPAGCPVMDVDGILQANPSTGHCISLRTILGDARSDPEWVFRTECLCQWSDGSLEGPFPPGTWDAGRWDKDDANPPQIVGNVMACVDMSQDRIKTYVSFAGRQVDGSVQVELVAERAGSAWVVDWLRERKDIIDAWTAQTRGAPVSALVEDWARALDGEIEHVDWQGADLPGGTGKFYDLVREGDLTHNPWPSLDLAAATAVPKLTDGGAFMWDRKKSPTDAAPLQAATGAVWLLTRPREEPIRSAYETSRLEVI
jgi:hypothetical protein